MDKLNIITQPIRKETEAFNLLFKETLSGHNGDFQFLIDFISNKKGKHIRPIILFLSAGLCGKINRDTINYALVLELLHTATLIHDDVVDNTMERRAQPSVNAKYDNRIAVLLGDFILSLAIQQAVSARNFAILDIISHLAENLADGELSQLIASKETLIDEKHYFDIIRKKTAILLASCSEMGALSVGAEPEIREKLRLIGENLGICFQIRDDVFDYFEQGEIGKPTGNDIGEGKITLPLLYALHTAPKEISEQMLSIIRDKNFSPENVGLLIDFAIKFKGIEYSLSKMQEIRDHSIVLLNEFPDSEIKSSMIQLIDYIIEREK
jgi:octaprenyl-diphosphate synthase